MLARRKLSISIKTPAFIVFRFLSLTVNHSHMDAPCQRIMQVLNQPELPSGCRWFQNAHGSGATRSQRGNRSKSARSQPNRCVRVQTSKRGACVAGSENTTRGANLETSGYPRRSRSAVNHQFKVRNPFAEPNEFTTNFL